MKSVLKILFLLLTISVISCTLMDNVFSSDDKIWIEVASGERQCIPPTFASLEDALNQLTSNGIGVYDQQEVGFLVCEACSCPTGIVYQAKIDDSDYSEAQDLGWGPQNSYE